MALSFQDKIRPVAQPIAPTSQAGATPSFLQKARPVTKQPAQPAVPVQQPKEHGFVGGLVDELLRPVAEFGVTAYDLAKSIPKVAEGNAMAAQAELNKTRSLPFFGKTKSLSAPLSKDIGSAAKQIVKSGIDIGTLAPGGGAVADIGKLALKKQIGKGLLEGLKVGSGLGALGGVSTELGKEDSSILGGVGNVALGAVSGGLGGAILGATSPLAVKALGKLPGFVKGVGKFIASPLEKTGQFLEKQGTKVEERLISPIKTDLRNGFNINNVWKYDLGGNLSESLSKTQSKLIQEFQRTKQIVKEVGDSPVISINDAVEQLKNKYSQKGSFKLLGIKNKAIETIDKITAELDSIMPNWRKDKIGVPDALEARRAAGLYAAFEHDPLKGVETPAEKVWNDFYLILKDQLEKNTPDAFKDNQKIISDLIPIEQTLLRRIPQVDKHAALSLTDSLSLFASLASGRVEPLVAGLANKVGRTGSFADVLIKIAKDLQGGKLTGKIPLKKSIFQLPKPKP